jgi:hypothetical protein
MSVEHLDQRNTLPHMPDSLRSVERLRGKRIRVKRSQLSGGAIEDDWYFFGDPYLDKGEWCVDVAKDRQLTTGKKSGPRLSKQVRVKDLLEWNR